MAAEFRSVQTRMWREDGWFQGLETDARLLFIYLFTNPSASISGIYRLPLRTMAFESGLSVERVQQLLNQFAEQGKAHYADGVVWVVKMRENQLPGKISTQVETRLNKDIASIPDCALKRRYLIAYGYPIDTVSIPRATETTTETVTETVTEQSATSGGGSSSFSPDDPPLDKKVAAMATAVEANGFGTLTPLMSEEIAEMAKEYPLSWIGDAFRVAVKANKRKLSYVSGVLNNWKRDGYDPKAQIVQATGQPVTVDIAM